MKRSRWRQTIKHAAVSWMCLISIYFMREFFIWITNYLSGSYADDRINKPENVTNSKLAQNYSNADLRIIVLAFNRTSSLEKLLRTLNQLELDGDKAVLEIFIDREKYSNRVSKEVVNLANKFRWKLGPVRIHIQSKHVGIYGQWIDSWRPKISEKIPRHNISNISTYHDNHHSATDMSRLSSTSSLFVSTSSSLSSLYQGRSDEIALLLEDDLSMSPLAYRWLKAAQTFYENRSDIAGITLQCENVNIASTGAPLNPQSNWGPAFMYNLVGSWGFVPNPQVWKNFQKWYHKASLDPAFHPAVEGLIMTTWYRGFEKSGKADTMWTMWFIYYCHQNRLFTLYANLKGLAKSNRHCLAVNRQEPGLHFSGKPIENEHHLLHLWSNGFVNFSKSPIKIDFFGRSIP